MKRKLPIILIIILCLCSVLVFSSCDAILDMIFGPSDNPNPQPTHVHQLTATTYEGQVCTGQGSVTYYKCDGCGKCFVDEQGTEELADVSTLSSGHLYVIKCDEQTHCRQCKLCNTVDEQSIGNHASAVWRYDLTYHYKKCDVCETEFAREEHTMEQGQCAVCHRHQDYTAVCASSYGYEQLSTLEHGDRMQKLYNKIRSVVSAAHNNAELDIPSRKVDENGLTRPTLSIDCADCYVLDNEAYVAMASFMLDNPVYYWISKQAGISSAPNGGYVLELNIIVDENYAEGAKRAQTNSLIYEQIDYYMSYVSGEKTPYNIALALHDEIARNTEYARTEDGYAVDELWAHSIEGLFTRNSAVCEGYAKAFQLLLNACGVDNIYVIGESNGEGHAWNLVDLGNGNWYWYDLTWDDQPTFARGVVYNNLCKTDAEFEDHFVSTTKQGLNYLYDLPATATEKYETEGLEINDIFSDNGCNYQLIGYNSLALVKCVMVGEDGVLTIPSAVAVDGKEYDVVQIDRDALVTYNLNEQGQIISITGPSVRKIIIPSSVEIIYNKSIHDCSSLVSVVFEDVEGWNRYAQNGQNPNYEEVDEQVLSNGVTAAVMLKQTAPVEGSLTSSYTYVWVKLSNN